MKNSIFICTLSFTMYCSYAQDSQARADILKLEGIECEAIQKNDTATLRKIWVKDFTEITSLGHVNSIGKINVPEYSYLTRQIETLIEINDNVVLCMGKEFVVPIISDSKKNEEIERRYANIWEKKNGNWKLLAKHSYDPEDL